MNQYNKIAVLGGSGKAGHYLVRELLSQNYAVKLLLRKPDSLDIHDPKIEIIQGDAINYNAVRQLLEDCDAIISTIGKSKGDPPVFKVSTSNVLKLMNELSIKRYILLTGLTVDAVGDQKSSSTRLISKLMKLIFPRITSEKQDTYELLKSSMFDWTLVRIPKIEITGKTGNLTVNLKDCPGKIIRVRTLASFLVDLLKTDQFIGEAPFIAS